MSEGLVVELTLPFRWRDSGLPECRSVQATNRAVYELMTSYEEKTGPRTTERQPLHTELAHIEAKLSLVLQLLTHVIHQQTPLPAVLSLQLSASHVAWQTATATQQLIPAQDLELTLHLDPRIPLPVYLCGQVESVATDGWASVQLQHHDEAEADEWERWLFRQHRRLVARSRHGNPYKTTDGY